MRKHFLERSENLELLLSNYMKENRNYSIPTNITQDEMYKLGEEYIESKTANIKFLQMINTGIRGISELKIDAKLKLKSGRRIKQIELEIFSDESGHVINDTYQKISVYTTKEDYDAAKEEYKNLIEIDYLKDNNSNENLLEYMIYFNFFFTENWILNLCSFPNFESSTFERMLLGANSKNDYELTLNFKMKHSNILLTFKCYQKVLNKYFDLRIEELITYFFSIYCKEQFYINWLPLDFSNKMEKVHIQTKNLFTLEEQIRKQWKLLSEENEIEKELFGLESTPTHSSLKSFLEKKYILMLSLNLRVTIV